MKAKDTVKTYGELRAYCIETGIKEPVDYDLNVAQAEISFKAGCDEGLKVGILDAKELDEGMLRAERKAGIREVVEWIDNNYGWLSGKFEEDSMVMSLLWAKWQAKLKEWGLSGFNDH